MSNGMAMLPGLELSPRAVRAHAMKNCLAVIVAVCRLAETEAAEQNRKRWMCLQSAADRLRGLLAEDLATESKDRAVPVPADAERCSVEAILKSVISRLEVRAEVAGVHLGVDCGGGMIEAEVDELGEALFNLVANAIEATPRGGAVSLTTRELANGDHQWVLRDTGHGITGDQLEALGRARRTRKKEGWGLGFALAHSVITRHRGKLRVDSIPGSGTLMTILLMKRSDRCQA